MPNIVLILQKVLDGIHQQNIVSGLRDKNIKHFNTWEQSGKHHEVGRNYCGNTEREMS